MVFQKVCLLYLNLSKLFVQTFWSPTENYSPVNKLPGLSQRITNCKNFTDNSSKLKIFEICNLNFEIVFPATVGVPKSLHLIF